jgi:hypothetical protein
LRIKWLHFFSKKNTRHEARKETIFCPKKFQSTPSIRPKKIPTVPNLLRTIFWPKPSTFVPSKAPIQFTKHHRNMARLPKIFVTLALVVGSISVALAQMERTIYQTFEVDSAQTITLDLVGFTHVQIEAWAGNTVLTEVNIQLWDASNDILNYFVEQGRYKFGFEKKGDVATVTTEVRERKVIRTRNGPVDGCLELSSVKIFVPDNYDWTPTIEADSDGAVVEQAPGLLKWRSGVSGNAAEESFADRNKHKLVKTLTKKPAE